MKLLDFIDRNTHFFKTKIDGITLEQLSAFALCSRDNVQNFKIGSKYIVPIEMLPTLAKHLVSKLIKENADFPLATYSYTDKSTNSSKINQIFIEQDLLVELQGLDLVKEKNNSESKWSCKIQITCNETIMLQGVYFIFGRTREN